MVEHLATTESVQLPVKINLLLITSCVLLLVFLFLSSFEDKEFCPLFSDAYNRIEFSLKQISNKL